MRVLVCGGRDFTDRDLLRQTLDGLNPFPTAIIHGAARGADTLAGEWAEAWKLPVSTFPAHWERHGRSAGHLRNAQMLAEGKPDLVVAFPGGRGTADMVRRARTTGVPVIEITKETTR